MKKSAFEGEENFFKSNELNNETGNMNLIKAKEMPIGTISNGRKKVAPGKWIPVKKEKIEKKKEEKDSKDNKIKNPKYKKFVVIRTGGSIGEQYNKEMNGIPSSSFESEKEAINKIGRMNKLLSPGEKKYYKIKYKLYKNF